VTDGPSLLPQLDDLLRKGLYDIAGLLEGQTRSRHFSAHLADFIRQELQGLQDLLAELGADATVPDEARAKLATAADRLHRLEDTQGLLFGQRERQWQSGAEHTRAVLGEYQQALRQLNDTLIDKDLLERQSQVLEQIILNYERLTQWQEFVGRILEQFRTIFPFQFFFVAFAEENSLALYLYHSGSCPQEVADYARQSFAEQMLDQLGLPQDSAIDMEEHWLEDRGDCAPSTEDVDMVTVEVPEYTEELEGLLGVAYGSDQQLTTQERSTIRSILAVMVMVVGSSRALARTMEELEYYAVRDPLTSLYNRRHFNEILEYEVGRAQRHAHSFSLLLVDLDDFKDINDAFGHPTGDRLLRDLTTLLQDTVRRGDVVARIGGDEFGILLPETDADGGRTLAESLRETVHQRTFTGTQGEQFHLTVSIGVVTFPADAGDFNNLLARVDEAMYRAKEIGKNEVALPEGEGGDSATIRRRRLDAERMREALEEGRIQPHFHGIYHTDGVTVHGYEALARLRQADGETLPAGRFMGAVERYGLARDLDRYMVEGALQEASGAGGAAADGPRLFINLSAQEIQNRGILGYAEQLCEQLRVPPQRLVFELLERQAIEDLPSMRGFLDDLRSKGFAFALDDFGSGYNSFHYLRELEFEYVKIDGAFVRNIRHSNVDRALVEKLTMLCADLGIATIAEFVESPGILETLADMGVDYVQGFHLGLPTPHM
jgi:diguanylate cyclase (GGDEF)-like protein